MLKKKMLRDIKQNLSQFITIFLMVMIGVMVYCGIESYMAGMQKSGDTFYTENNLQDLNVMGTNFTTNDLENIKKLDYVNNAERKLSITASTDNDRTLLLNFIESNNISQFYVYDGVEFDYNTKGVWLDNFYAIENNISVGDSITIKYNGYTFIEVVVGLINVPDHLYDTKDDSEIYPDHKNFGFAYLSSSELEGYIKYYLTNEMNIPDISNIDYKDYLTFNYIMVDVNNKDNVLVVKDEIENNIDNALAIVKIEDTKSYSTYQGEIDEGKTYVGVFSGLFIFIAMLSVITTMTRVVKMQRTQIGTLKALGFKDIQVILHYISYGFWISLIGSLVGLVLGYYGIGNLFISIEMSFFELPNGHPIMVSKSIICTIIVVLCVCLITLIVCYKYLKKNPAETLRVASPKVNSKSLNITTKGIFKKMKFATIWNIRDIFRNKIRTITGIVGIAGCCTLIVCAFGMLDSLNYFVKLQFDNLYNFDYKLSLSSNISSDELKELTDKYGDNTSESYLIEIKDENGNRESNNIFIASSNDYIRFVDKNDNYIKLDSNDGVYITYKLAEKYNYKVGDTIVWRLVQNEEYYESKIVGFNKDPQNQNMTMTDIYFESLGNTYKPDSIYTNVDLKDVSEIKNVELIQDIEALKESMSKMLQTMKSMIILIIFVAILLGVVIIYNMGVLSFSERVYQFATLKVLGFKDKQIKKIFIKQNTMISIFSIIIGLPLGYYLVDYLFKNAIKDSYDFSAYILPYTYIYAGIGMLVVSYLVSLFLSKKINNIDMVSSLKGNE